MTRQRDFKAEYQRRKELAAERALSTAQARGHARVGETSVSELKRRGEVPAERATTLDKVYRVFNRLDRGESLSRASRSEGIAPKTVKDYNKELGLFGKTYQPTYQPGKQPAFAGWFTGGDRAHFPLITRDGAYFDAIPLDEKHASIMGKYWNAVEKALAGDDTDLKSFAGRTIYDLNGNKYRLSTDSNAIRTVLMLLTDAEQENFERNFYQRKGVQRAA